MPILSFCVQDGLKRTGSAEIARILPICYLKQLPYFNVFVAVRKQIVMATSAKEMDAKAKGKNGKTIVAEPAKTTEADGFSPDEKVQETARATAERLPRRVHAIVRAWTNRR